ncbi:uncharacterized protein LOC142999575 isoform X2 [Genypterus blacodes]|uniref:uncharacterized protein LOC142999575 isoform X2 n=1 Tax=Genypterus blacodes TaxID=154954 RepID=UPI003F768735
MYLWRLSLAVILGLIWYFSDCGRTLTQYFLCLFFCFLTPLLVTKLGRESSTQTDEEEHPFQETIQEKIFGFLTDGNGGSTQAETLESQYPHVKKSLQKVFECAYAQLVLPWYRVPEPREQQPLHRVLSREFDYVFDRMIERAKDFDVCQAGVGSIRTLTQHLHNAKQSNREPMFSSRYEEIAVLREFSEAVVRNLFAESLCGQEVNRCALNEIIALKGLELLVTWLSDPDNLNQLVVSQLDSMTPKGSVEDLCGSDQDQTSLASQEDGDESSEVSLEGAESTSKAKIKGKKRGNKLKEGWSKFVDKIKSKKAKKKKMKKMEQELVLRIMTLQGEVSNEDNCSSREGSVHSQQNSDEEDSDLEDYLTSVQEDMMEFTLSYEMWRVGHWAVSIPHADWQKGELVLTLHLEEKDSPENLQWDIKKAYMDIIYFRNRWQDSTSLPGILVLEEEEVSDEAKEEARLSVEHFLQELVSDNLIGPTQPVFQFLCPLDKLLSEEEDYGGVWSLLSGLAYFLTPGQEEEENPSPHTEAKGENVISLNAESTAPPLENPGPSRHKSNRVTIPSIVISQYDPPSGEAEEEEEAEKEQQSDSSNETGSEDKTEDSDKPKTSPFKMIFRQLSRSKSQESLASTKTINDDDQAEMEFSPVGVSEDDAAEGPSWRQFIAKPNKREKTGSKGTEQGTMARQDDEQFQKYQASWEQQEATKALFDLLKEISGKLTPS